MSFRLNRRVFIAGGISLLAHATAGADQAPVFRFDPIGGKETIELARWRGHPVLVVNTASHCSFRAQLGDLQHVHEAWRLRVLAVPSDDFGKEFETAAETKAYCEIVWGMTVPMSEPVLLLGEAAHPFYRWLRETRGVAPNWTFNKVLLDGAGQVVTTWGAPVKPGSEEMKRIIAPLLTS